MGEPEKFIGLKVLPCSGSSSRSETLLSFTKCCFGQNLLGLFSFSSRMFSPRKNLGGLKQRALLRRRRAMRPLPANILITLVLQLDWDRRLRSQSGRWISLGIGHILQGSAGKWFPGFSGSREVREHFPSCFFRDREVCKQIFLPNFQTPHRHLTATLYGISPTISLLSPLLLNKLE